MDCFVGHKLLEIHSMVDIVETYTRGEDVKKSDNKNKGERIIEEVTDEEVVHDYVDGGGKEDDDDEDDDDEDEEEEEGGRKRRRRRR